MPTSRQLQISPEEGDDGGVEVDMKSGAVEPGRAFADEAGHADQGGGAGREKIEMIRLVHDPIVRPARQIIRYGLGVIRMRQDVIIGCAPKLDRRRHAGQTGAAKAEAQGRRGGHDGLQTRIVGPVVLQDRRGCAVRHQLAVIIVGMRAAVGADQGQVRYRSACDKHGETAG